MTLRFGIFWAIFGGKSTSVDLTYVCDFVGVLNGTFHGALKGPLFEFFF